MLTAIMRANLQNAKYERTKKQYELDKISRSYEDVTSKLSNLQSAAADNNKTSTVLKSNEYKSLQAMQQTYDVKKETLEQDLEELKYEIDSYNSAVKSSAEKTSTWNLIA